MESVSTAVPHVGRIYMQLDDLCAYIDVHPSLQQAEIVATECYVEAARAVKHRFLIVELRRRGRKDVFLRLDRRREEGVPIAKFVLWSGKTKANDVVSHSFLNFSA